MSEKRKLLVATGNPGKMREVSHILKGLPFRVLSLQDLGMSMTVEETGATFADNAILKASAYCASAGILTMADDSGLVVDALDGRPGVLSARYGGEGLTDPQRVELLLRELEDVPWEKRTARFRCVIALAWPDGQVETVEGDRRGCDPVRTRGLQRLRLRPYLPSAGKELHHGPAFHVRKEPHQPPGTGRPEGCGTSYEDTHDGLLEGIFGIAEYRNHARIEG